MFVTSIKKALCASTCDLMLACASSRCDITSPGEGGPSMRKRRPHVGSSGLEPRRSTACTWRSRRHDGVPLGGARDRKGNVTLSDGLLLAVGPRPAAAFRRWSGHAFGTAPASGVTLPSAHQNETAAAVAAASAPALAAPPLLPMVCRRTGEHEDSSELARPKESDFRIAGVPLLRILTGLRSRTGETELSDAQGPSDAPPTGVPRQCSRAGSGDSTSEPSSEELLQRSTSSLTAGCCFRTGEAEESSGDVATIRRHDAKVSKSVGVRSPRSSWRSEPTARRRCRSNRRPSAGAAPPAGATSADKALERLACLDGMPLAEIRTQRAPKAKGDNRTRSGEQRATSAT